MNKEQKEAIEYLEKYTKWETYGERNLEKDIITVLELLKETQKKLKLVNDYNYWVQLAVDRGIELENLQNENETLKNKLSLKQFDINVVYNDYLEKLNEYKENSISIQKVKDKIEELNKAYEDSKDENGESEYYYPDYTIRVLEELLESE